MESGLLSGMNESFQVMLALDSSLSSKFSTFGVKEYFFSTSKVNRYVSNLVMDSGTWRYRRLSSSFRYRIKRRLFGDISFDELSRKGQFRFFFAFTKNLIWYLFLGNHLSSYILKHIIVSLQRQERQVRATILESEADIVLIWSQTLDPASSAFIYNSRHFSIPNLLIADNWDNLFSKTVFPITPDFVGCFGEQSANFGSKLHSIPRNRFFELGSARFDVYRKLPAVGSRRLIIFAGSSMPEDDETVLSLIDQVREESSVQEVANQLCWRYRPHPVPQHTTDNFATSFPNIEFTNQRNETDEIRWPSMSDAVVELANTRVAICMPTSYLLEALVCEVPVIIPVFESMVGLTSSKALMSSLAHLKDVKKLPGVFIATSPSEFKDQLSELISKDFRIKPTKELDFFVNWTQGTFLKNLTNAIFKIEKMNANSDSLNST
jgi:hypothetical protein